MYVESVANRSCFFLFPSAGEYRTSGGDITRAPLENAYPLTPVEYPRRCFQTVMSISVPHFL